MMARNADLPISATAAAKLRDLADEWDALNTHFQVGKMQNAALLADNQRLRSALVYLESEARMFAEMYPPASDGRNTFLIFADKILAAATVNCQPKTSFGPGQNPNTYVEPGEARGGLLQMVEEEGQAPVEPCDDAEVMRLWRECGLPEYFLGNGGTNHKLVAFADRIRGDAFVKGWMHD